MKRKRTLTLDARNELRKATSVWLRTISLAAIAVAIIEPIRSPESMSLGRLILALVVGIVTFTLSLIILVGIEMEMMDDD